MKLYNFTASTKKTVNSAKLSFFDYFCIRHYRNQSWNNDTTPKIWQMTESCMNITILILFLTDFAFYIIFKLSQKLALYGSPLILGIGSSGKFSLIFSTVVIVGYNVELLKLKKFYFASIMMFYINYELNCNFSLLAEIGLLCWRIAPICATSAERGMLLPSWCVIKIGFHWGWLPNVTSSPEELIPVVTSYSGE